ncbi:uncharacterized protein PHACADRAFT_250930 [Phanerochaete carnosa HHB-10118-sp]|uniref:Uncharacterized protein n=1 Tax=Phanerochaete carnosa (strain HHB-10118-sp) TaxID=650164 RepID=K5W7Y7_PHACS|nr:uncharacterized protein PHACADRAFT_250930 [Phanerochaete carnosa HHB-10118-sp]EKM60063.1 hypothetical protein PHACADRAFT_250930 [Phanerochaete carnosa HHB-10118-sp]
MFDADELEPAISPVSTESAVIVIGATTQQRSVKPAVPHHNMFHPHSAPPQVYVFSAFPGKILRSQTEVATQLEAEAASTSQTRLETVSGPTVPRQDGEQNTATVLYDDGDDVSDETVDRASLSSLVYGSDILQVTPSKRRADGAVHASPAPTQTSFALSSCSSRRTTYRLSHSPSIMTTKSSTESSAEWDDGMPRSAVTPRSSTRRHALLSPLDSASPSSSTSRHFWRRRSSTRARAFSASIVTGTADTELAPVRESSPAPGAQWLPSPDAGAGNNSTRKLRRRTFGQSARFSRRMTASSSSLIESPTSEPVPPLPTSVLPSVPPAIPPAVLPSHPPSTPSSTRRYALPTLAVPVPKVYVSLASPATLPLFTSASVPAAPAQPQTATDSTFGLPASAGMVKGPRPPPSVHLSGGALQERRDANTLSEISRHRRTNSSPSEYSQESHASLETVRRPSMQW